MAVEASIVLVFGEGVDEDAANVAIEIDDEYSGNIDWEGKVMSSFSPDDKPVVIIQYDSDYVRLANVRCTDGSVQELTGNSLERTRKAEVLFTALDVDAVSLGYLNPTSIDITWHGNTAIALEDEGLVPISGTFPCVGDVSFRTEFNEQWQLTPPSMQLSEDETYTIYIVVYMEAV